MMKILEKTGRKREREARAGVPALRSVQVEGELGEPVVLAPRVRTRLSLQEGREAYLWSTERGPSRRCVR